LRVPLTQRTVFIEVAVTGMTSDHDAITVAGPA